MNMKINSAIYLNLIFLWWCKSKSCWLNPRFLAWGKFKIRCLLPLSYLWANQVGSVQSLIINDWAWIHNVHIWSKLKRQLALFLGKNKIIWVDKTCRLRAFKRTPSPLSQMYLERKEWKMFRRLSQNLAELENESKREAGHLDKAILGCQLGTGKITQPLLVSDFSKNGSNPSLKVDSTKWKWTPVVLFCCHIFKTFGSQSYQLDVQIQLGSQWLPRRHSVWLITPTTGWEDAQARCKDQRRLFPRKQQPDNPRNRILFGQKRIDEWYQQKPSSAKTEEGNPPRSS